MRTPLRIAVVTLCVIALFYLVVLLARGIAREDAGTAPGAGSSSAEGRK